MSTIGKMEAYILEIGMIIRLKGLGCLNGVMEGVMRGDGWGIICMDGGFIRGVMGESMKGNLNLI